MKDTFLEARRKDKQSTKANKLLEEGDSHQKLSQVAPPKRPHTRQPPRCAMQGSE